MAKIMNMTRGHVAIVDDEDYAVLSRWKWHYSNGYAKRRQNVGRGRSRIVRMHRVIMGDPPGVDVDHRNGDKLDNRRYNLRLATDVENLRNQKVQTKASKKSVYKGVSRAINKYTKKDGTEMVYDGGWRAYIVSDNRQYSLGNFPTQEEAARAYDAKARELFGEFARLNFPDM